MKYFLLIFALLATSLSSAQQSTGSIVGKLTDQEYNNEPLAFANVVIKGTTIGTTSDFDGLYEISGIAPGTYILVYSYLGYETVEIPNVTVEAGKVTSVDVPMSAGQGMALDEVVVTTVARKDSETALLLDQKRAIEIKESIGAVELGNLGISDVKSAATKISGVTESEASGDVFVRGLGDRYLTTTFNGLPIPSDDIEKKNIDLGLFPTRVIQNVSISKTYSATTSADQASGNINIASRELSGTSELEVGVSIGANTNAIGDGSDGQGFKVTANYEDTSLGFYDTDIDIRDQITNQSWDASTVETPANMGVNISGGKSFFDNKFKVFGTLSNSKNHKYYSPGEFLIYDQVTVTDSITDFQQWETEHVNNAMLDLTYQDEKNIIKSVTLFVNTLNDVVSEGGRNGFGNIQEETIGDFSDFLRDQNTKQTRLFVTQLIGNHKFGEKNVLDWAVSYNKLNADEPNRIRNIINFTSDPVNAFLYENSAFESRKLSQTIDDEEYNGLLKDRLKIIDEENKKFYIDLGANYRKKTRDFESTFYGVSNVDDNRPSSTSLDDLDQIFTDANFNNNILEIIAFQSNEAGEVKDEYTGEYESIAGFALFNVGFGNWNFNAGLRAQQDEIVVNYDVANAPGGEVGSVSRDYTNVYPSLNIKYALNEEHALRFAASRSITLPEFKEIAPFRYISPTGQQVFGTVGDNALEASFANNFDLKWEFFPTRGQLVSASLFYKSIEDPINKVRARGSDGALFTFRNTGEEATIYGIEIESKIDIITPEMNDENGNPLGPTLSLVLNASRMWHEQDLIERTTEEGAIIETFRYGTNKNAPLQGASDWIMNSSLNLETSNNWVANVSASYASDKIFAMGFARAQEDWDTRYNDAILEKGFVVLNSKISKQFGQNFQVSLSGQNLLNPKIEQSINYLTSESRAELEAFSDDREVRLGPGAPQRETITDVVRSYTLGRTFSLGLKYTF
ncbi:TonB-dependent receptor [Flagellimonas marinaquae]|uniref:TonB-dependent receptor n=1 Tax=Flagellimonas aurea TaxID=2915619 RepID=A0ABS3FZ50_9FLAO|nr:TonB-dependent receptor [Allomuricauda aurea]MBC73386.1 TonB-dependent receptor [Allomuricauda sp.]MBO0352424.1 TonB-dependent receptor [Allomuricauda aurea]UBZ15440.1 TonB-dependent receptor [Allomuricauda aquimarina]|tara:strand:+ start:861 stop:3764 length:2904 start_codon:yes stop_codon:yes gene_type:complete